MTIAVSSAAIAAGISLAFCVGSAAAQPLGESYDARTICSAISETGRAHPKTVASTKQQ